MLLLGAAFLAVAIWAGVDDPRKFLSTLLNGLTLAALYFLVASGFTLVFGLMRNVNLAHGSIYLAGAYFGWVVGDATGNWFLAIVAGFLTGAALGILLQVCIFRFMPDQELRQTMVTIGISIVLADLMLWGFGGDIYSFDPPSAIYKSIALPILHKYPTYRLVVLGIALIVGLLLWALMNRTRVGMMIRAGVDDRDMLAAARIDVQRLFAFTFAIGAGLAGFAGVIGGTALSISPGEDTRYLMASLVVVIVGGMGSIPGAALGALLIGLAEQFGLAYASTYGVVFTFLIMVLALSFRPRGLLGSNAQTPIVMTHAPTDAGAGKSATNRAETVEVADRPESETRGSRGVGALLSGVGGGHVLVLAGLLLYPLVASPFFIFQIGGQALALGLIALSLTFLGGFGGMLSLAQASVGGVAGYAVAIFGVAGAAQGGAASLGWPWPIATAIAIALSVTFSTIVGWLSVRTEGIYTIMISLAIGVSLFYLVQQNYSIFGGHEGFNQIYAPHIAGVDFQSPVPYYYLALFLALACYAAIVYLLRAPFGIALQGIRDNPRRMSALGYNVTAYRVAAYAVAGVPAACGGILLLWYNNHISPGSVGVDMMVNVLIVVVLGGMKHPIGAFVGATVFVLLQNFAIDIIRERFNLVIGLVFLSIVLFSPDGLLGLWRNFRGSRAVESALNRLSAKGAA
jgi:branched-subunit amino acid ABC-type transport system permease component